MGEDGSSEIRPSSSFCPRGELKRGRETGVPNFKVQKRRLGGQTETCHSQTRLPLKKEVKKVVLGGEEREEVGSSQSFEGREGKENSLFCLFFFRSGGRKGRWVTRQERERFSFGFGQTREGRERLASSPRDGEREGGRAPAVIAPTKQAEKKVNIALIFIEIHLFQSMVYIFCC